MKGVHGFHVRSEGMRWEQSQARVRVPVRVHSDHFSREIRVLCWLPLGFIWPRRSLLYAVVLSQQHWAKWSCKKPQHINYASCVYWPDAFHTEMLTWMLHRGTINPTQVHFLNPLLFRHFIQTFYSDAMFVPFLLTPWCIASQKRFQREYSLELHF